MKRREFITLLGGVAAGWPVGARTQPIGRVATIGIMAVARLSPETKPAYDAFFAELRAHGFVEGDNLVSMVRWIDEDASTPSADDFIVTIDGEQASVRIRPNDIPPR